MFQCPICYEALKKKTEIAGLGIEYDCLRCGVFTLSDDLKAGFSDLYLTRHRRSVLSHRLRSMQTIDNKRILVLVAELQNFQLDDPLPSPAEQVDKLLLWVGERQPSPVEYVTVPVSEVSASIGAAIKQDDSAGALKWLLVQAKSKILVKSVGYIDIDDIDNGKAEEVQLTMAGWERYEALKHAEVESRTAFMAMQFGDSDLDNAVARFKQAVKLTGFDLRLLSDGQPAGLIDDQLRVRLRTARFVIADLTHRNNGAYWEAGFAEGLGRPVIYTCRRAEWDERDKRDEKGQAKVHFDTNHLVTIIWDPSNLEDAASRLTATIRATLPAMAKMTDE